MFRVWLPWLVILAAVVGIAAELVYVYPQLPDPVASHFNLHGQPDDWMPKRQFVGLTAGIWLMLLVLLAIPSLLMQWLPAALINMPNKRYWLAPERSAATRRMLGQRMAWFSAATLLFLTAVMHGSLQANLPPHPPLEMWVPLGFYLAFTAVWLGEFIWRFARPPQSLDPST